MAGGGVAFEGRLGGGEVLVAMAAGSGELKGWLVDKKKRGGFLGRHT
jgi:hypothetical protein